MERLRADSVRLYYRAWVMQLTRFDQPNRAGFA